MTEQPTTDQQSADVAQDLVERVWAERLRPDRLESAHSDRRLGLIEALRGVLGEQGTATV